MSLTFEYIRYKNILSSGNNWTHIDLNKSKSTLIVGENGAGKSTMLDALCFGLYGRPFRRINKPQLLNAINQKNLEVEVAFRTGGKSYKIKRGIKPNLFEIWNDDVLINQDAAARDYQVYLEENILKMNVKSFAQIVVLGSSTFVPFMQLPAKQRREVIEDLLDIQIFTTMNTLLKEKVQANKEEVQELKYQIDLIKQKIESAQDHNAKIRKMKRVEVDRLKKKVTDLNDNITNETTQLNELSQKILELQSQIEDKQSVNEAMRKCEQFEYRFQNKLKELSNVVKFFEEHDECPTCWQNLTSDFKQHKFENIQGEKDEINSKISKVTDKKEETSKRLEKIQQVESQIDELRMKERDCRASIKISQTSLKTLKEEYRSAKQDAEMVDESQILEYENDLKSFHIKHEQLIKHREVMGVMGSMLKDGGIKTRIIRQYVPIMNKLINKYLSSMDFFVDFQLDETFNETIKSRFRDNFSYSSFSEGEKAKIDIALILTWRTVSTLRNSVSSNLLILDEVFDGSLDGNSVENLQHILKEMSGERNFNVFIISHKEQNLDQYERIIKFKKVKNFSMME